MFSDLPWYGKALALAAFFAIIAPVSAPADQVRGTVVFTPKGCRDYFLVETPMGLSLLQAMGFGPSEGDELVGEIEGFGMIPVYNISTQMSFDVWVDDYMLSKNRAIEKLRRHCF